MKYKPGQEWVCHNNCVLVIKQIAVRPSLYGDPMVVTERYYHLESFNEVKMCLL